MDTRGNVARHDGAPGLFEAIRSALIDAGKDLDALAPMDLAPVDEFHPRPGGHRRAGKCRGRRTRMPRVRMWGADSAARSAISPLSTGAAPQASVSVASFAAASERLRASGPPPLGIHLLMGETAGRKIENLRRSLVEGRVAIVQGVARKI